MNLRPRDVLLVALALAGFAANSVLCRMALSDTAIDPASFVAWRLGSGAVVLALLTWLLRRESPLVHGDWRGAAALFVYAVAFSYAYVSLHAGLGALLLFGAVQVTMIAAGLLHGERLRVLQWCGVTFACGGLVLLKLPVGGAPVPVPAAVSMLLAGVAWGVYSLLGRGAAAPLAHTATNFVRAAPFALLLLVFAPQPRAMPLDGVLLAVLSGALASGVGYALWYAVLPRLRATQAGLLQLLVPVLTAGGGRGAAGRTCRRTPAARRRGDPRRRGAGAAGETGAQRVNACGSKPSRSSVPGGGAAHRSQAPRPVARRRV